MQELPQSIDDLAQLIESNSNELRFFSLNIKQSVQTELKKKRSGGVRTIVKPNLKLKILLKNLHQNFLINLPLHKLVYHRKNSSYIHLIKDQKNNPFILTADIKDFYPNVTPNKIYKSFRYKGLNDSMAKLLTKLTSYNFELPQGFPTSPTIASMVIEQALNRLDGFAKSNNVTYGIYADNLVLSSNYDFSKRIETIKKIFSDYGFLITKFELMNGKIKEIMNIEINRGNLKVKDDYMAEVLESIRLLNGLTKNIKNFHSQKKSILGKINFVKNINHRQSEKLMKSFRQLK